MILPFAWMDEIQNSTQFVEKGPGVEKRLRGHASFVLRVNKDGSVKTLREKQKQFAKGMPGERREERSKGRREFPNRRRFSLKAEADLLYIDKSSKLEIMIDFILD